MSRFLFSLSANCPANAENKNRDKIKSPDASVINSCCPNRDWRTSWCVIKTTTTFLRILPLHDPKNWRINNEKNRWLFNNENCDSADTNPPIMYRSRLISLIFYFLAVLKGIFINFHFISIHRCDVACCSACSLYRITLVATPENQYRHFAMQILIAQRKYLKWRIRNFKYNGYISS